MASKPKGNRIRVNLVCPDCKRKNYITTKNKMNTTDKLKLDKYCPWCRKNLTHNEGKVASGS